MFSFPKTRMLREAEHARTLPLPTGRLIGLFFLVFGIAMMGECLILLPAQIFVLLTSSQFQSIMGDASLSVGEQISAVLSADIPQPAWMMALQLFATATMTASCLFFCLKVEKRNLVSMGFVKKNAVLEYLSGLIIGLAMLSAAVFFCIATGQLSMTEAAEPKSWGMIVLFFAAYLIQGLGEELLCRSFMMVSLSRGCKPWVCIFINSLLFAALHLFNKGISPVALVNLTLFGVFASAYTLRRGSIWGIAAIHSMWNFTQGNVFGISVSGMSQSPSVFVTGSNGGMALINGGEFGLEGGLGVTLVLAVSIAIILIVPTKAREIAERK